jgi:class 3 adenylate cyclase
LAILFADVTGSTQLYETLGDVRAREVVGGCLAAMTEATHRFGGTLIKTIGDEVMCKFPDAEAAARAGMEMQDRITGQLVPGGHRLSIRVGFHYGPTLLEDDDVFGDTVNLAARMTNQAKAGQILTTPETVAELTGELRAACRQVDLARIKGKHDEIAIHELMWRAEDATIMRVAGQTPWVEHHREAGRLMLIAGDRILELSDAHPSLTIGRADQNDLILHRPLVSRLHALLEYREGRFVLTDVSANGTYVQPDGAAAAFVHRDSCPLTGAGTLGLGEAVAAGANVAVRYEVKG